jgi:hypothetical protein
MHAHEEKQSEKIKIITDFTCQEESDKAKKLTDYTLTPRHRTCNQTRVMMAKLKS